MYKAVQFKYGTYWTSLLSTAPCAHEYTWGIDITTHCQTWLRLWTTENSELKAKSDRTEKVGRSDLGVRPPLHSIERGRLHAIARELIGVAHQLIQRREQVYTAAPWCSMSYLVCCHCVWMWQSRLKISFNVKGILIGYPLRKGVSVWVYNSTMLTPCVYTVSKNSKFRSTCNVLFVSSHLMETNLSSKLPLSTSSHRRDNQQFTVFSRDYVAYMSLKFLTVQS